MSLYWYRRPRLVVLSSNNSVLEAARAMENNSIGAIMVQDRGRIVGIVTDRDLAVRALGHKLDPETTPIAKVMTPSPLMLTPDDSREEAIALMQQGNVRRIPLNENGRVVGMVTLDDLNTIDSIAWHDHHPGAPVIVHHAGKALTVVK